MIRKFFLVSICFIILSCSSNKNEANSVADNFVKHYYKFMNIEEAQKYTSMMAKDKIDKEVSLIREARVKNPNSVAPRSEVTYKLEDVKTDKDMSFITYHLSITPKGSNTIDKMALITVKNENGEWKVIDYSETDTK
ncbi:MAG: hypothetical protein U0354_17135 [Candidatus Sericytochromatia bacterium]